MNTLNILDLFSGIGGFSKGIEDAGFKIGKHYASEVDPHAQACYQFNFKKSIQLGTVTNVRQWRGHLGKIDVLTFGSPCQDFSICGNRKGLKGGRSALIRFAIDAVRWFRPGIFIWENVKGAFSSNAGRDFAAIWQAFADIDSYRLEGQCLNLLRLLPQHRERWFIIGHLATGGRGGGEILPLPKAERDVAKACEAHMQINKSAEYGSAPKQQYRVYNTNSPAPTICGDAMAKMPTILAWKNKDVGLQEQAHYPTIKSTIGKGGVRNTPTIITKDGGQGFSTVINNKGYWNTITAGGTSPIDKVPVLQRTYNKVTTKKENMTGTIQAGGHSSMDKVPAICINDTMRRLTEIEVERLFGFPDNWTKWGNYNGDIKEIATTNRYKLLGNSVAPAQVKEIAELF